MKETNALLKTANTIGFAVTVIVNAAANILPLNGVTTGELSDKYANLFTPAGYVFSIWSVIYTLLAAFIFYQMTVKDDELHKDIGWLFVTSSLFNSVWIFLWHYEYILISVLVMLGLLGSLILIYTRLKIGLTDVSSKKLIMVHTTFSVYLGWITVATIANITALLVDFGFPAFDTRAIYITSAMILIAMVLTMINTYIRGDVAYAAVIIWAQGGIVQKQIETQIIPLAAGISIGVIILTLVLKKSGLLDKYL